MGIEATGDTLEELFANAAQGLRELVFSDLAFDSGLKRVSVSVTGIDLEELLVSWLNEILYLFEIQHLIPVSFQVCKVEPGNMSATIVGKFFHDEPFAVERDVKAVTYHQLLLEKRENSWLCRFFVDL